MLWNHRRYKKSFKELVQENKQKLLNDKQALEIIEKRIEKRHEFKKPASFS
ncbi:MAG: FbpB family small basic protein [Bacillota bacterium]